MTSTVLTPLGPPPLPYGWTEHNGPGGQTYYYNAQTLESTYTRPLPALPVMQPQAEKDKPLIKTPIPGTDWLRIKTTRGNVFYSHKVKKNSIWTIPEEIKDAVALLDRQEEGLILSPGKEASRVESEQRSEVERIKSEVQEVVKRKLEQNVAAEDVIVTKKAKVTEDEDEEDSDSNESEEEDWQREAALQLAAEAEIEKKRVEKAERAKLEADTEAQRVMQLAIPNRVDLSVDEAKALFKTLLREKDINPLHPWDTSLPLFVSDPRYVLLPSVSARREAFDEYCRDRARELRQTAVKKEKEMGNPKEEFELLLKQEVKSTRLVWTEFRRIWKKDRRFYGWGRDDREREKLFREYIRELGEKKRTAAQKAEADFFALLKEHRLVQEDFQWKEVKQKIDKDSRYVAVGSSSLREELFNTFLKGSSSLTSSKLEPTSMLDENVNKNEEHKVSEDEIERIRKETTARAMREREEKVRADRNRLEADIGRSRAGIHKDEGEREFNSLLTDAVRDPQRSWETILPQLKTDPRFTNSPLSRTQQLHLYRVHVEHLRSKHIHNLHAIFQSHTPSIATPFSSLPLQSLLSSLPVTKLDLGTQGLEYEFEKWQRERTQEAKQAFDQMLTENSFIDFWGRLGKIGGEGVDGGVKADELEEDEGEGGGGKVDMKVLAKNVDVQDMEKVLKNDQRYITFDHIPEQRERWIRDYLSQLSAPKLSVHLQQSTI